MKNEAYFFGCWKECGHVLRDKHGYSVGEYGKNKLPADFPIKPDSLDGSLLYGIKEQIEGRTVLSHIGNWTIISFWDRSVDKRPGSNASFVIRGKKTLDEAKEIAKAEFPSIYNRFTFPLILAD